MTTDLVVVIPGVTGSSLADARGRESWGVGPGGIARALRTLGGSIKELALPDAHGDGPAPDGVTATGLISGLHVVPGVWSPIDGYGPLTKFLLRPRFGLSLDRPDEPGNLVLFAYDWRLSNRWTAGLLKRRVDTALERWRGSAPARADAKVVFICHSMGGLVARWCADRFGAAEVTRAIVTIGTPHRGSLNALAQLVNGVRKGIGPLKADLTRFGRSLPSSYQLLPEYACVEGGPDGLLKTIELELPSLDTAMTRDGMRFHDDLDACAPPAYDLIPIVGIGQPTWTTARLAGEEVEPLWTIDGKERGGDGTVPRLAAIPNGLSERDRGIRGAGQGHGALAVHRGVLRQLDGILTAEDRVYRDAGAPSPDDVPGVVVDDLHEVGELIHVKVRSAERRVLEVHAIDERGVQVERAIVDFRRGETDSDGRALGTATLDGLSAGGYAIEVGVPDDPAGDDVQPVRQATVVWEG
jgi:hypothetical protein